MIEKEREIFKICKMKMKKDIAKDIKNNPRLGLVSPYLIEAVGKVRTYGSDKYNNPENGEQ